MIERITEGMRGNVVGLAAYGKISHEDYQQVVIPALEEKLETHTKLRLFFHLGEDFVGYSAEAIWDDTKIGIKHFTAFEKIAVITDILWVREAVRLFGIFVPCPIRVFPNEELKVAAAWV